VTIRNKIIVTQNMDYNIREMTIGDYEEAYHLWELPEGLCLDEGDYREAIGGTKSN